MMNGIKFRLSGRTGFFKKPDVNAEIYYTYNNIHKVALLGLLGAIIGLGGYNAKETPEFYEKLKTLKISIVPCADRGYFAKRVQYFNNSTGYASLETGGNLQVKEQWLENPCWEIYLMQGNTEKELWDKLKQNLLTDQCTYIPYLGKNDHPALIDEVVEVVLEEIECSERIDSLFSGEISDIDNGIIEGKMFIFTEYAPYALDDEHGFYLLKRFIFTSQKIMAKVPNVFKYNDLYLAFH